MSEFMSRDELLAPSQRRFAVVSLPGGGKVRLRSLNERERGRWEADSYGKGGGIRRERLEDAKRRLIVMTVVDADGNPILRRDDVEALAEKDAALVATIYAEATKLNGVSDQDLEELVGNSGATEGDDSPTG